MWGYLPSLSLSDSLTTPCITPSPHTHSSPFPHTFYISKGPICLFCVGLYQQAKANGASFYAVMFFTCMWAALMHFVVALLGLCETFPNYITGFSADSFGVLIGLIYIYEGIHQLISIWSSASLSASLFSLVLAVGTLEVTRFLANLRDTQLFGIAAREMLADYAAIIVIVAMSACQLIPTLTDVGLPLIDVPSRFTPSTTRPWVVVDDITGASREIVFSCIGSGLILSALLWFDHNISALLSRKENKNGEGSMPSYDWDFMLLGVSVFICGVFCLPPNYGLLPQAPLHVKHLTYLDSAAVVDDDNDGTDTGRQKKTIETRWSALLQSALMWSLLSSDLLLVIGLIPKGVLAGLFVYLGIEGLRDNHLTVKFIRMLSPNSDDDETSQKRIGLRMTELQLMFVLLIFGITFTPALLVFPIFIVSLVVVQMGIDRYGFSSTPEESLGATDFHDGEIRSHEAEIRRLEGAIRALDSEGSLEVERVNEALSNRVKEWSLSRRDKKWEEDEKSRNVNYTQLEITLGFPRFCKWFFNTAGRRPVQRRKILLAIDSFIESKSYFEDERHAGEALEGYGGAESESGGESV